MYVWHECIIPVGNVWSHSAPTAQTSFIIGQFNFC